MFSQKKNIKYNLYYSIQTRNNTWVKKHEFDK